MRRKVAVKVLKRGVDADEVLARFEAERQAMATMSRPNIAQILDAGATGRTREWNYGWAAEVNR